MSNSWSLGKYHSIRSSQWLWTASQFWKLENRKTNGLIAKHEFHAEYESSKNLNTS